MPAGRPTDYRPEMVDKVNRYFEEYTPYETIDGKRVANPPPFKYLIADYLGVSRNAIWEWEEKHPEFGDALKKGMAKCFPQAMQVNALLGLYNPTAFIFTAKNRPEMNWVDKQEVKHNIHVEPLILQDENGMRIIELGSRINGNPVAQIPA